MLRIVKVTGDSLSPLYLTGDFVLLISCPGFKSSLKKDDIIVFHDKNLGQLIKSIQQIDPVSQTVAVAGFHPLSTGTDQIGPVPYQSIIGKVIYHFKKPREK